MFNMNRKKSTDYFVSIGAGINQIPLIQEAKKAGFQVIGVDMNASAPGFYHCDLKIQESVQDYENIYIKLRELLFDGSISAIMTKSFGDAIVTTSFLCEKFGLPFLPFSESRKFTNKNAFREAVAGHDILMPEVLTWKTRAKGGGIKSEQYPVIVKPYEGHAKKDVLLINSPDELAEYFSHNQPSDYMIERFITGDEIICAGMIHEKKYYHVAMSDKKTTPHPHFVDLVHSMPSRHSGLAEQTAAIGQSIAEIFNIQTAPVIMEFIVNSNGSIYLLEAIPEFGGEFIPDIMIPSSTGYNHLHNLIMAASGKNFIRPGRRLPSIPVVVKYITGPDGTLASCSTDTVKKMDNIIFTRIFKHMGEKITSPASNHDRIGVIVASGKTTDAALTSAENAEREMNIRIRSDGE